MGSRPPQQVVPSAWRGGEKALAVADRHSRSEGLLEKPIVVELEKGGMRLTNGANPYWYAYTRHPTSIPDRDRPGWYFTSILEEDLRELDCSVRVDGKFEAFVEKLFEPGALRKLNGHPLDVRKWRPGLAGSYEPADRA